MAEEAYERPADDEENPEIASAKTTIDSLLDLLRTRGRTELNSVAAKLNIDPRIIENWAKVLENGNLIKISYEVGKMYLEPITLNPEQQADVKTKTDITKFILEEDLAVERISLDKFAKSIEDLNSSIKTMEKLYQQKMPAVQKILADVDSAYAPIENKKKNLDKIKADTNADLKEVNKNIEALTAKMNAMSSALSDSDMSAKLEKLNSFLANIDNAQKSIGEMERTNNKFFDSLRDQINNQINEFRKQTALSKASIMQSNAENAKELNQLMRDMQDKINMAKHLSKDTEGFKRQFDSAKRDADVLGKEFNDKYQKLSESMGRDSALVELKSKSAIASITQLKSELGGISEIDDDFRRWKKDMADLSKEVLSTRNDILKLTNQLNIIEANKSITVERKAKAIDEVSKSANDTKKRTNRIKEVLNKTADEIRNRKEGNVTGDTDEQ